MNNRLTLAAFVLVMSSVPTQTLAQCVSDECRTSGTLSWSEVAALEAAVLSPVPRRDTVPEPELETSANPAPTPTHFKPWLFLQLRQFAATGINQGSLYTTELDFGVGIPLGTPHLSLVLGASIVGGAYRDVTSRTLGGYMGLGMFLDARLRLNVTGPIHMFMVSGARINVGGPLDHGVDFEGEDCPSLTNIEASFGLGAEFSWRRQGLFSMSVRGVRRRSVGELSFAANGTNPPITSTRGAWGIAATIEIGAYFD